MRVASAVTQVLKNPAAFMTCIAEYFDKSSSLHSYAAADLRQMTLHPKTKSGLSNPRSLARKKVGMDRQAPATCSLSCSGTREHINACVECFMMQRPKAEAVATSRTADKIFGAVEIVGRKSTIVSERVRS